MASLIPSAGITPVLLTSSRRHEACSLQLADAWRNCGEPLLLVAAGSPRPPAVHYLCCCLGRRICRREDRLFFGRRLCAFGSGGYVAATGHWKEHPRRLAGRI